jgi:hypothetical protein
MTTALTNIPKNRYVAAHGGEVFFGWMFMFTQHFVATGPTLTSVSKNGASLSRISKNTGSIINIPKS